MPLSLGFGAGAGEGNRTLHRPERYHFGAGAK
jgi:hypothetical protein